MSKKAQDFYHTSIVVANKIVAYTAVSNFNTLGIDLSDFNSAWSIQISRSASDGTPTVTIQCSNDNTNWEDYKDLSNLVSVKTGEIIIDDEFIPNYMRLVYVANSATGTLTFKFFK